MSENKEQAQVVSEENDNKDLNDFVEIVLKEMDDTSHSVHCGMDNQSFPDPGIANYWRDRADRIIWIDDEITPDIIGVARNIARWNMDDAGKPVEERVPIKIYINSPGGHLLPTFAVCDAIRMSKTPVYGINMHEAASAAAMLFACCHKRMAMPNAFFLLHLGSGGSAGTYQQTRAMQEDYNHKIGQMIKLYKDSLVLSDDTDFDQLIDTEWYLYMDVQDGSRNDARRYNLITDEMTSLYWE